MIALLAACSPVHTASDAPFELRGRSVLFLADELSGESRAPPSCS